MQSGTSNKIIKLESGYNNFNNLVILPRWELPNLIQIHVYNTLFLFFEPFRLHLPSKSLKSANMSKNILLC